MAILQKVNVLGNERVDLIDLNNIQDFTCADFEQIFKKVFYDASRIIKGFRIYQDSDLSNEFPTTSPIYVEMDGSVVLASGATSGNIFSVGATGTPPTQISLTNSAINYIELELTEVFEAEEARAFWDPTALIPGSEELGKEFAQVVNTVRAVDVVISVNTTGFNGGNKLPIAEIEVNNVGTIIAMYDRRNLFFRLGRNQPFDADYKYPFSAGRLESVHEVVLDSSSGFYIHNQAAPLAVWTITHNLGIQYVAAEFYDENGDKLSPTTVEATDTNTLTVTFSGAKVGYAAVSTGPIGTYFQYTNGAASTTWVINHNLGVQHVNFACYDASNELLTPLTVTATNANTLTVEFSGNEDGHAIVTIGNPDGRFQYTNGAASDTWVIEHDLGYQYGVIKFYDGSNVELVPATLSALNPNTIEVTFAGSEDGVAIFNADDGGTYLSDEVVIGAQSNTAAKVGTPGTTSIEIYGKTDDKFIIGETLVGQQSGTSRKILNVKENFNSADKSIKNFKEMIDALMTEIAKIKFGSDSNRYWFETSDFSLKDLDAGGINLVTVNGIFLDGGGVISWDAGAGELSFTADFTIPVIGTIYTNTILLANSPLILTNGDVAYVDVNIGANANIVPVITSKATFSAANNRFIFARRESDNLYIYDRLVS